MAPPPINEISFKTRQHGRSKSFPSVDSKLTTDLNDNQEGKAEQQPTTRALPPKPPPSGIQPLLSHKKKPLPKKSHHRRVKSLKRNRVQGVMSRSEISSLTSWTGSLMDDSTASVIPSKPQDIFRTKSPPRKLNVFTPKSAARKQEVAGTPQRKNTGAPAPTNDATPIRHNLAPPTAAAAPPPSPTKSASPSLPLPASYSLSCNESMSTNNSSLLNDMTKRAVDNVMDNLLFEEEDEMENYSLKSMEEQDSYFGGDSKKEEASKMSELAASSKELTKRASRKVSSPKKHDKKEEEEKQAETATNDNGVTHIFKKKAPIPEVPVVETASNDDSYFDRDMDVSSLALENVMSTLEREQGTASDHWHFNVRSLRYNKEDNEYEQTQTKDVAVEDDSKVDEQVVDEPNPSERVDVDDDVDEKEIALTLSSNQKMASDSLSNAMCIRGDESSVVAEETYQASVAVDDEKWAESVCSSRAASQALLSPDNLDDVSLTSNKSKELVVAVGSENRNASWWLDTHDEETGTRSRPSGKRRNGNKAVIPEEEEQFTFRKTFMFLFLIIGVAAITGGIAALVTSKHQKKESDVEPNVQATSPPRITPPPTQATTDPSSSPPPSAVPTTPATETTLVTEQPNGQPQAEAPTASPTVADTLAPTVDHLKLSLYERIELFSPESIPALDNATTPQARALEWALQQSIPSLEQYSLATLHYSSTEDWSNDDGWLTSSTVCDWYGVVCSGDKVTELTLSFNNLISKLPDELSLLTDLQVLSMSGAAGTGNVKGRLTGTIPASWGSRLVNLVALELYDNQLTGQLPTTFQYLTDLEMLNLDGNKLWGPLPTEFGALSKLDILDLSNNELSGTVPTEIGLLTNLVNMKLHDNEFTGMIPTQLGEIKSLKEFHAQDNVLMGSVPRALYSLSNLMWLDLSGNELDGILPPSIGLWFSMEGLLLYDNRFTGPIPVQLSLLTNLRALNLAKNVLTGTVPTQLGLLESMTILNLDTNLFQGTITDAICDIESLRELTFSEDCDACPCCTDCSENN